VLSGVEDSHLTDHEITRLCDQIELEKDAAGGLKERLISACALVHDAPHHPAPQVLAAKLLEQSRIREDMLDTWEGVHTRFPASNTALRFRLRWLQRQGRTAEAIALLDAHPWTFPASDALLISEIKDAETQDRMFEKLLAQDPNNTQVRVAYGKSLFSRGALMKALDILDEVRDARLSPSAKRVLARNDDAIAAMEQLSATSSHNSPAGPSALRNAISVFADRTIDPPRDDSLRNISLYSGSLGAGGAERQMTQLASALHKHSVTGRRISGVEVHGDVEVIVNTLDAARGKQFHLPTLLKNQVQVRNLGKMPALSVELEPPLDILEPLRPLLPKQTRFGLDRLTSYLIENRPDVFYIWQDGAVLSGVLAALIADIPHIAISLRGLPPNLRPEMMRPEYLDMYQALADVPGVSFSTNSYTAADAYADWIQIPRDRFSVIHNSAAKLDASPSADSPNRWHAFETETADARFTLCGVFRFTPNKRGQLWIDWAGQALRTRSDLRFILVGDGPEFETCKQRAAQSDVASRILFVGKTDDVGFWLSKSDAMLLLSRNEGLPNVLIEAQLAGLPVISTPAGGASETFIDGETGFLLSSATNPDFAEFATYLDRLIASNGAMSDKASALASQRHDPSQILASTVRFLRGEQVGKLKPKNNVAQIENGSAIGPIDKRALDAYKQIVQR
jgi:glycosyltransferase involved in cell wall biosynthesis